MATITVPGDIRDAYDAGHINLFEADRLNTLRKKAVTLDRKIARLEEQVLPLARDLGPITDEIRLIEGKMPLKVVLAKDQDAEARDAAP